MRRCRALLIACGAAALLAGCGGSGGSTATTSSTATSPGTVLSGTVHVAYRNIQIDPEVIKVRVGTRIIWTNYDTVEHNVTSESGPQKFASQDFGEGGTYQIIATKPGVIHYLCTIHPASMKGTIEVVR